MYFFAFGCSVEEPWLGSGGLRCSSGRPALWVRVGSRPCSRPAPARLVPGDLSLWSCTGCPQLFLQSRGNRSDQRRDRALGPGAVEYAQGRQGRVSSSPVLVKVPFVGHLGSSELRCCPAEGAAVLSDRTAPRSALGAAPSLARLPGSHVPRERFRVSFVDLSLSACSRRELWR